MMEDKEIVAAVRNGSHILVPRGGEWAVGQFDLDQWEGFEGKQGLMVELKTNECKDVAKAMFGPTDETASGSRRLEGDAGGCPNEHI